MRSKIIAVNAVIVVIVGLLSFIIVRQSLLSSASNPAQLLERGKRDALSVSARLQFNALRAERWLAAKVTEGGAQDAVGKATAAARGDAATAFCDAVLNAAKSEQAFSGVPSLVVLVDGSGRILGRNGSNLSRGEDLGAAYPALKDALAKAQSGSDIWVNPSRNDQYLASYAPVRDDKGTLAGALVIGLTLNDALSRVSEATTGRGILIAVGDGNEVRLAANSTNTPESVKGAFGKAVDAIKPALAQGHAGAHSTGDMMLAYAPLDGFGSGHRAAVVTPVPSSLLDNIDAIAFPILGAMLLGLVLVVAGGWLLGSYMSRPIALLEEGLLGILNGQTDRRFELDHAELGGLAFRIDQLLNQLMGVEEDTTDDEGRPSKAPTAAHFTDAMAVGEQGGESGLDPAAIQRLAQEPAEAYYNRIYGEYIEAKRRLGESTAHITDQAFRGRIQNMEADAQQKYGRPVRYQVQSRNNEVVLLAVPLP